MKQSIYVGKAFPEEPEDEKSTFEIKAYLKVDLARLYFPCLSPEAALRKLRSWINRNPALHHELYGNFEGKNDQSFSKRQIAVLVKYLDVP